MRVCAITTTDNPFNPILDFDNWYLYDLEKNYGTCEYLARIIKTAEALSENDFDEELERTIDEIVELESEIGGIPQYKKVIEEVQENNIYSNVLNN